MVLNMRMVLCVLCSRPAYYGLLFMPSSHALGNTPTFGNLPPPPRSRRSDQPPESAFHPETGRLGGCPSACLPVSPTVWWPVKRVFCGGASVSISIDV